MSTMLKSYAKCVKGNNIFRKGKYYEYRKLDDLPYDKIYDDVGYGWTLNREYVVTGETFSYEQEAHFVIDDQDPNFYYQVLCYEGDDVFLMGQRFNVLVNFFGDTRYDKLLMPDGTVHDINMIDLKIGDARFVRNM